MPHSRRASRLPARYAAETTSNGVARTVSPPPSPPASHRLFGLLPQAAKRARRVVEHQQRDEQQPTDGNGMNGSLLQVQGQHGQGRQSGESGQQLGGILQGQFGGQSRDSNFPNCNDTSTSDSSQTQGRPIGNNSLHGLRPSTSSSDVRSSSIMGWGYQYPCP